MTFSASLESGAKTRELTLGEALAFLASKSRVENAKPGQEFSAPAKSYLQSLRERVKTLSRPERIDAIFKAVPEHGCQTEKPLLADNEDFFLACFLASSSAEGGRKDCWRLFRHLNNCFRCFEVFYLVMQDYYHQTQELSNLSSGKMTNPKE